VLQIDRPAAVKTGTTSNFHDNWTIGYTPNLVVGVWAGNTSYAPMREVDGLTGAAPIWHEFIRAVLSGTKKLDFIRPQGVERVEICALSGLLPGNSCPYRRLEWFLDGTQPTEEDHFYRLVILDARTGFKAGAETPHDQRREVLALDLPSQAWQWARSQSLVLFADLLGPGASPREGASAQELPGLSISSPADGSQYHLSTFANLESQRIMIQVLGSVDLSEVEILVDGQVVQQLSNAPFQTWWTLEPGAHQVWATGVALNGDQITSNIVEITVYSANSP
jgi:membrane carboxypeptidase/penicillin-binding protein PbpC